MLTFIQSAGVTPEVNLRITQVRKCTKGIHPGFETQGRHHQKSKTEESVAPQKDLCSPKISKKNNCLTHRQRDIYPDSRHVHSEANIQITSVIVNNHMTRCFTELMCLRQ